MPKKIHVHFKVSKDDEAMSMAAADAMSSAVEAAIQAHGIARIAISGGGTPKRTFELLADPAKPFLKRIDWSRLLIFWVDERCVPPDSQDSNYGMAQAAFLSKVPLPKENVVRVEGELDPKEAAARYESALRNHFRLEGAEIPRFDWILLGLGDNGHTASLFPHSSALQEMMALAIAVEVEAKNPWRVTLTWPVINRADRVVFLVQGASKADVLQQVMLGPYQPEELPAQLIRPDKGNLSLLLDQAAAAKLPTPALDGTGFLEVGR